MKMFTLNCPECNGSLQIENGIDTFFCKYCGHKIILNEQSDSVVKAKVRLKELEHEETITDKKLSQERYKMELGRKNLKFAGISIAGFFLLLSLLLPSEIFIAIFSFLFLFFVVFCIVHHCESIAKKEENILQKIVSEVEADIRNKNYDSALIKANTIYSESLNSKEKWNNVREHLISVINDAKRRADEEAREAKIRAEAEAKEAKIRSNAKAAVWIGLELEEENFK